MAEELKPCPFCGGAAQVGNQKWNKHDHYGVICTGRCGAFLDCREDTAAEAAKAWNTRFEDHPLVQMIKLDEELGLLDG